MTGSKLRAWLVGGTITLSVVAAVAQGVMDTDSPTLAVTPDLPAAFDELVALTQSAPALTERDRMPDPTAAP